MKRRASREVNVFGLSFLDVLANAVGGLAFLLILAVMMVGAVTFIPPQITTETLPAAYQGRDYEVWLAAREGRGKFRWQWGRGEPPPGLQLDQETGRLGGVISATEAPAKGVYEFEVLCHAEETTEPGGTPDRRRLRINVLRELPATASPLRILSDGLPEAFGGAAYPLALAAEGGQAPLTWRAAGRLPRGLTLTPAGTFSGAPGETGKFAFTATVRDSGGQQAERELTLVVSQKHPPPVPPPPLRILTDELPPAVAWEDYSIFPAAEGGVPPYRWKILRGQPAWLNSRAAAAAYFGSPAPDDVGTTATTWEVTDSKGASVTAEPLELTVLRPEGPEFKPLQLRSERLPEARVKQPYQVALSAEGGKPPYRWSIAPPLPGDLGIQFSSESGVLAGLPRAAGAAPLRVTVQDSSTNVGSQSRDLALRIRPPILPVRPLTKLANEGRVGEQYDLALAATGGHPPYHWSQLSGELPPGLEFDEQTGRVTGVPQQPGLWEASFAVADDERQPAADDVRLQLQVLTSAGFTKLKVKTRKIPVLIRGAPASLAMACEGGRPPYQWEFVGDRPPGLRFDESTLRGAASQTGVHLTKFRAADSSGQEAVVQIPVIVRSLLPAWLVYVLGGLLLAALLGLMLLWRRCHALQPRPLEIVAEQIPNARASCDYVVQLACAGGVPPYRWSLVEGQLPPGMQLTEDGRVEGRPLEGVGVDEPQEFSFTVEVRDSAGATTRQQL